MVRAVGVDLGGTKVSGGVVDDSGRILERHEAPSGMVSPEELRDTVVELVGALDVSGTVGVGVGAAGIVDHDAGRYLYGPNMGLREVDVPALLSDALGADVLLDNDANCAAWAEHRFGAGRGAAHLLCITLGTGVGGGLVLDGRPYRGAHGGAAEVGHMVVVAGGVRCGCGNRGCWEQYASGQAIERLAREGLPGAEGSTLAELAGDPSRLRGPMVTEAARRGDAFALQVLDEVAGWIGLGLASLVNVLEPERIIVSGGLVVAWDLLADGVREAMGGRVEASEHRPLPDVVPAGLGPDAGLVGAALLALDASHPG